MFTINFKVGLQIVVLSKSILLAGIQNNNAYSDSSNIWEIFHWRCICTNINICIFYSLDLNVKPMRLSPLTKPRPKMLFDHNHSATKGRGRSEEVGQFDSAPWTQSGNLMFSNARYYGHIIIKNWLEIVPGVFVTKVQVSPRGNRR